LSGELVKYTKTPSGLEVRPAFNLNLAGVNVLGNLGRVLGEVILYRIEARRAQERLYEMQKRAEVAHWVIDAHTKERLAELTLQAKALDGELGKASKGISLQQQTLDGMKEALRAVNEQIGKLGTSPNATRDRRLAFETQKELVQLMSEFTIAATSNTANAVAAIVGRPSSDLLAKLRALPQL
jgi:phage shock protein A